VAISANPALRGNSKNKAARFEAALEFMRNAFWALAA
jgi:hypothetical protein